MFLLPFLFELDYSNSPSDFSEESEDYVPQKAPLILPNPKLNIPWLSDELDLDFYYFCIC